MNVLEKVVKKNIENIGDDLEENAHFMIDVSNFNPNDVALFCKKYIHGINVFDLELDEKKQCIHFIHKLSKNLGRIKRCILDSERKYKILFVKDEHSNKHLDSIEKLLGKKYAEVLLHGGIETFECYIIDITNYINTSLRKIKPTLHPLSKYAQRNKTIQHIIKEHLTKIPKTTILCIERGHVSRISAISYNFDIIYDVKNGDLEYNV